MDASFSGQLQRRASRRRRALSVSVLLLLSGGLGLVVVVLSKIALLTLVLTRPEVDARAAVANALANFLGNIPLIGNSLSAIAGDLGLAQWLEPNLDHAALIAGFLIGLAALWPRSCKATAQLFLPMDRSIALPLPSPRHSLEPLRPMLLDDPDGLPMAWVEPIEGVRKDVWLGLADFALGRGKRFEYQLLLGGPGSGKTRMSIEFARRILAKKGASDDDTLILHGHDNHDAFMTRAQRLRSWWRIRVVGQDPLPNDIWHVGWFSPEALAQSSGRLMIKGQLANSLKNWRPTRPTFLLLDDPLHDDSVFVVETMLNNAASFRHRVRLLIVNQTVPGDMRFRLAHLNKAWESRVHPPFADPLVLSANAPLSDGEIRLLARRLPPTRAQPILNDSGLREFQTVTRGNPLLVELGFAWLCAGKPLQHMTEERLLEDRTRRFLDAIKTAGFEAGQGQLLDLLTMATIANGAPTTLPAGGDGETVWSVFGVQRINPENAARLFPGEADVSLLSFLPPMRPEALATAFARMVLADLPQVDRNRIIRTAWRANPSGTLRTLVRIAGGYKFRTGEDDPLQSAFEAVPMHSGLAPIEVFCLLAQASCSAELFDWEDQKFDLGAGLLEGAIASGQELSTNDLPKAFSYVIDLILADRSTRMLRESNAARLLIELLRALDRAGCLFDAQVLDDLARWASSPRAHGHSCLLHFEFGSESPLASIPKTGTTASLLDLASTTQEMTARILMYRLMRAAAAHEPLLQDADILRDGAAFIEKAEVAAWLRRSSSVEQMQSEFPELLNRAQPHPVVGLAIVTAFVRVLAHGGKGAAIEPLIKDAASLAATTAKNAAAQNLFARVGSAASYGYATMSDRILCRQMAERVEAIAQRFPDHEGIQRENALAWRHAANATLTDPILSRQLVDRVEAIALRFPENEEIQTERALAWHVINSSMTDPALCRQLTERVEAIALRFPDHGGTQRVRAEAWRHVTHATTSDPALCREMAERVEAIALRFPKHPNIQQARAEAWRHVTLATKSDPALCREMAERVEAIARRFPHDQGIQQARAEAWRYVTYSTMSDSLLCRQMADQVEAIASRFPDHEVIQSEIAFAWGCVNFATRSDPALCREMAERVEAIARRFPKNEAIQVECAECWRYVTYATMSDPPLGREMAERVEAIARRFPQNTNIQKQAQLAASYLPRDS